MSIPSDYVERVYAGILGKLIGVYLGRPFEGWTYERITRELGQIDYYVHERLNKLLVVTDDDISGTFAFLRALPDYGNRRDITPAEIGQTWLNYIIEGRTILWWGGLGNSTEHTAYLRLKSGIPAPESGSMKLNGKVVSEQIGAQIFIDGWAMVAPGDPEFAADLARRAASVSHDGEAIYGAQVLAAMESLAFVERDIDKLIDTGVSFIPKDSVIYRMIEDIRGWKAAGRDWLQARELLAAEYGYDKYGGNCHMVPNHGLVILGLLYGEGDFHRSLTIVNTCGWDTDCNSGNLGCLLGIRNGLQGIEAGPDWRGPVADRMYISTADGGSAITDAVRETYNVVNIGRALAGLEPVAPKRGARFHFELPGSVQGFMSDDSVEARGVLTVENALGHSREGSRSLALRYRYLARGRVGRAATATFIPPEARSLPGYELIACPTLYAGQKVSARLEADENNNLPVEVSLYLQVYDGNDELQYLYGPSSVLQPGQEWELEWTVPDTSGLPIARIGFELRSEKRADGAVYVDYLTWEGSPKTILTRPQGTGEMWLRSWVNGVDHLSRREEPYRLIQNHGTGLLIHGTREWRDYSVRATVRPHMVKGTGIAARVQGMTRYYALLLTWPGKVQLVRALGDVETLSEEPFAWEFGQAYDLRLEVVGDRIRGWVSGKQLFDVRDASNPLPGGAIALVCQEGRVGVDAVEIQPAQ